MRRIPIKSSNIISIGYDAEKAILEVEFMGGSIYQYSNVPEKIFGGLMSARSKGQYFDAYVKKGNFPYRKIPRRK